MERLVVLHALFERVAGIDYPSGRWWLDLGAALLLVLAPAWIAWIVGRLAVRTVLHRHGRRLRALLGGAAVPALSPTEIASRWRLEAFVLRATLRTQVLLAVLSLLTLPAGWLLLELPKEIINDVLGDAGRPGQPPPHFLGLDLGLDRLELLVALCASYLAVLTLGGLVKSVTNDVRGRINERLVRRLRLGVARRARCEPSHARRATLAAVAVQEVEAIGYFGGGLVAVPLIQGGAFVVSIAFLLLQNAVLALAALLMLPVQLTLLPRLQARLNAKVRARVLGTRALSGMLTDHDGAGSAGGRPVGEDRGRSPLGCQMRQARDLERVRIEIHALKGRLKGLYNYTSNLTPLFLFLIGGYLVIQGELSLGALVAALTAHREIAPALRELFAFAQVWSDARARFGEIVRALDRADAGGPRPVEDAGA